MVIVMRVVSSGVVSWPWRVSETMRGCVCGIFGERCGARCERVSFCDGRGGDAYHQGHFVNDVRHGRGVERTRDGSLYVGEWKRGRHDGWGGVYKI